jgi:hypothetical protein
VFVEGKDIGCDTLKEEEGALDKDVPQHGRDKDSAEVPEYLKKRERSIAAKVDFARYHRIH